MNLTLKLGDSGICIVNKLSIVLTCYPFEINIFYELRLNVMYLKVNPISYYLNNVTFYILSNPKNKILTWTISISNEIERFSVYIGPTGLSSYVLYLSCTHILHP